MSTERVNKSADNGAEATSTSATGVTDTVVAAAAPCAAGGRCLPLSSPSDGTYLSPLVCLIRSQLEIFSATKADVEARASFGRFVQRIGIGRIGIRCIHCRDRPAGEQAKGAMSYPASIRVLNQATRNWQRYHWGVCPFIPSSAREEFERINSGKKVFSSRKSQEYWIRRSGEMGLVDTAAMSAASGTADLANGGSSGDHVLESEGIYFEEDARTLGLRILMPPEDGTTGTAKKKSKGKEAGSKDDSGAATATAKHRGNKRKNALGCNKEDPGEENQITSSRDRPNLASTCQNVAGDNIHLASTSSVDIGPLDAFPTLYDSLNLDDFGDDASFASELKRLAEEDEDDEAGDGDPAGGTIGMAGNNMHFDSGTMSAHAVVDESNVSVALSQVDRSSAPDRNLQLLSTLRSVREMVQSLRGKHDGASPTRGRIAADLHSLGEELYRILAAGDSAAMVASDGVRPSPDSNGDGRLSKRERRRDEDRFDSGTASLQDLGCPTNISIFVQSLIDATDEDATERFTSLSDVENDLRLMIDFPTKYLFDNLHETSTGRLGLSQELYGIQRQRERLMNSFQEVIVSGKVSRGLALISGRSGSGKVRSTVTIVTPFLLGCRCFRLASIYIIYDVPCTHLFPSFPICNLMLFFL